MRELSKLGFFKFARADELEDVVDQTFGGYLGDGTIEFPWSGLNRVFGIDAESVYESDGMHDQIESLLPVLAAMGLELTLGEYVEVFDNVSSSYTTRSLELNGKRYASEDVSDRATAFNSAFMLSDELLGEYGRQERVFALHLDEIGTMILLDEALFRYLVVLMPEDAEFRPLDLKPMMTGTARGA